MSTTTPTTTVDKPHTEALPLLGFEDVAMTFPGGTVALSGVDLTVGRGEFVSVVGPSGCGKSTLLRIASGLETASAGKVTLATDHIAYVFQDATLLPWRNVLGNVELLAELKGRGPKTGARRHARRSGSSVSRASRSTCRGSCPAA